MVGCSTTNSTNLAIYSGWVTVIGAYDNESTATTYYNTSGDYIYITSTNLSRYEEQVKEAEEEIIPYKHPILNLNEIKRINTKYIPIKRDINIKHINYKCLKSINNIGTKNFKKAKEQQR